MWGYGDAGYAGGFDFMPNLTILINTYEGHTPWARKIPDFMVSIWKIIIDFV